MAHASTITGSGQSVGVSAGAGEQNNIVITRSGDVTTITDTAGVSGGGIGCVPTPPNRVDCTSVGPLQGVQVLAGDQADSVSLNFPPGTIQFIAQVSGGDGNDFIDGSQVAAQNSFSGFAGDDTMIGGTGANQLDSGPAGDPSAGPGISSDQILKLVSAGNDRIVGGPAADHLSPLSGNDTVEAGDGDDLINSILVSAQHTPEDDNAADSILCGGGSDTATLGQGDQMGIDCELASQFTSCPAGGPDCEGSATITAAAGASGSAASAAGGKRGKTKVLGKGKKTEVKAGRSKGVTVKLKAGKVKSALGKRSELRATFNLGLAKVKGGKEVGKVKRRVRFKLRK